eukprot:scaffold87681_cov69-Phaeocystis_antarctica.AAC.6
MKVDCFASHALCRAEPLVSRPDDDKRLLCPGMALLVRVHSEREHLELCTYLLGRELDGKLLRVPKHRGRRGVGGRRRGRRDLHTTCETSDCFVEIPQVRVAAAADAVLLTPHAKAGLRPLEFAHVTLPPAIGERRDQSIELACVLVAAVTNLQLLLPKHRPQGGWHAMRAFNLQVLNRIGVELPVLVLRCWHPLEISGDFVELSQILVAATADDVLLTPHAFKPSVNVLPSDTESEVSSKAHSRAFGLRPLDFPCVLLPRAVGERRRQSIELTDVSVATVTSVQLLLAPHRAQGVWHSIRVSNVHALNRIGIVPPGFVCHSWHQLELSDDFVEIPQVLVAT